MGHVTTATPTYGRFMVRTQEGYVFYVCTKFEVNNLIRFESYKFGTRKFRNWVT